MIPGELLRWQTEHDITHNCKQTAFNLSGWRIGGNWWTKHSLHCSCLSLSKPLLAWLWPRTCRAVFGLEVCQLPQDWLSKVLTSGAFTGDQVKEGPGSVSGRSADLSRSVQMEVSHYPVKTLATWLSWQKWCCQIWMPKGLKILIFTLISLPILNTCQCTNVWNLHQLPGRCFERRTSGDYAKSSVQTRSVITEENRVHSVPSAALSCCAQEIR